LEGEEADAAGGRRSFRKVGKICRPNSEKCEFRAAPMLLLFSDFFIFFIRLGNGLKLVRLTGQRADAAGGSRPAALTGARPIS